jgi:DnaJ-class molecular chaperone
MHICPNCRGTGQTERSQTIEVKIPKGLKGGSKIRLAGLGGGGVQGGKPGDLYLRVRIVPHPIFKTEGHNLFAELPIWDDEAALGTEMTVPTLVGNVVLHIPQGTQNGHQLRLKGKGLPLAKGEGFGDLYWRILVVGPPPHLSEKERELYLELRNLRIAKNNREDIRKKIKP